MKKCVKITKCWNFPVVVLGAVLLVLVVVLVTAAAVTMMMTLYIGQQYQ
jgi:hypothetical protein